MKADSPSLGASVGRYIFSCCGSYPLKVCLISFYYYHVFLEVLLFNANSIDPHSAASDLGLHCLQMSLL